jgi:hypothetical protein
MVSVTFPEVVRHMSTRTRLGKAILHQMRTNRKDARIPGELVTLLSGQYVWRGVTYSTCIALMEHLRCDDKESIAFDAIMDLAMTWVVDDEETETDEDVRDKVSVSE